MTEIADVDWIPAGREFPLEDVTYFQAKGGRDLDDVLADIDLVITGPHATGAFPAEMQPWVDAGITRRLQYDFTDVSTSPVARAWAARDPHVLYIENPHPRAVRDANRARPDDVAATLREAFDRLAASPDAPASLSGVDAIRPVTFGYLPVLRRPQTDTEFDAMVADLVRAMALGVDRYETIRDELIQRVIDAKLAALGSMHLNRLDPGRIASATHLDVLSIHDTMNHTANPNGAISRERPVADRLPDVVALSNRGDGNGEARPSVNGVLAEVDMLTMPAARLRSIGQAYRLAFDAWQPNDIGFNRPYLGGYETQRAGPVLRAIEPGAQTRDADGLPVGLRLAAWQNEFLREFLLGSESTAAAMQPGTEFQMPPDAHVEWLAERLHRAHDLVRSFGSRLDPGPQS